VSLPKQESLQDLELLRDHIAVKVLLVIIPLPAYAREGAAVHAAVAYKMADAMLARRAQKEPT
jgi:hypothetical protein